MKHYIELLKFVKTTESLSQSAEIISWDQETMMPKGSINQRSENISSLEQIIHSRRSEKKIGELLSLINIKNLNEIEKSNYYHISKTYNRAIKIPLDLATQIARVTSLSQSVWAESRKENKSKKFLNIFKEVVNLKKQEASLLTNNKNLYNALINDYEPEMDTNTLDIIFRKLRSKLIDLRQNILNKKITFHNPIINYDNRIQLLISKQLANVFGFNFKNGRIDLSEHPFSSGSGEDVRITTRLSNTDPFNCFYSTIHETGHAVYEQNIDKKLNYTPNRHGASMAIHESQSRLFENQLGRSLEFCSWLFKIMKKDFKNFNIKNEYDLYCAVNKVENNYIRTEADELQYNLHIMMRYDLEKDLINGKLNINDIEEVWNDRFYSDFGFKVDKKSNGFLQDVHWSAGLFGYFPTYTLGNIYAGCLYQKMKEEITNLMSDLSEGNTFNARVWLKNKIHNHGSTKKPNDLIEESIGEKPSEKPLSNYLENKFSNLYKL